MDSNRTEYTTTDPIQFENTGMAMLVAGIALTVLTISGNLLTPWLSSGPAA